MGIIIIYNVFFDFIYNIIRYRELGQC